MQLPLADMEAYGFGTAAQLFYLFFYFVVFLVMTALAIEGIVILGTTIALRLTAITKSDGLYSTMAARLIWLAIFFMIKFILVIIETWVTYLQLAVSVASTSWLFSAIDLFLAGVAGIINAGSAGMSGVLLATGISSTSTVRNIFVHSHMGSPLVITDKATLLNCHSLFEWAVIGLSGAGFFAVNILQLALVNVPIVGTLIYFILSQVYVAYVIIAALVLHLALTAVRRSGVMNRLSGEDVTNVCLFLSVIDAGSAAFLVYMVLTVLVALGSVVFSAIGFIQHLLPVIYVIAANVVAGYMIKFMPCRIGEMPVDPGTEFDTNIGDDVMDHSGVPMIYPAAYDSTTQRSAVSTEDVDFIVGGDESDESEPPLQ
ncbi:hypothetical protein J8273_0464 [Carpediemonas membranifera]|uniref:Uncharacterized protein n=1 Tax=Carpediemonas membranifera TaxID=201153 RepID=A0A8J6E0K5_9EUKA|nr:hypothetical protein J8273_0464 [Carpediemonas membranifera]|eukprot:KAG9395244.1 hypothetical protein J8273_0464 [Carpediemonas membranifera]